MPHLAPCLDLSMLTASFPLSGQTWDLRKLFQERLRAFSAVLTEILSCQPRAGSHPVSSTFPSPGPATVSPSSLLLADLKSGVGRKADTAEGKGNTLGGT